MCTRLQSCSAPSGVPLQHLENMTLYHVGQGGSQCPASACLHHQDLAEACFGCGRIKEYSNTAYYHGPFSIGGMMNIRVKVWRLPARPTL